MGVERAAKTESVPAQDVSSSASSSASLTTIRNWAESVLEAGAASLSLYREAHTHTHRVQWVTAVSRQAVSMDRVQSEGKTLESPKLRTRD